MGQTEAIAEERCFVQSYATSLCVCVYKCYECSCACAHACIPGFIKPTTPSVFRSLPPGLSSCSRVTRKLESSCVRYPRTSDVEHKTNVGANMYHVMCGVGLVM